MLVFIKFLHTGVTFLEHNVKVMRYPKVAGKAIGITDCITFDSEIKEDRWLQNRERLKVQIHN